MTDKTKHLVNRLYFEISKKEKEIRELKNSEAEMLQDFKTILTLIKILETPGAFASTRMIGELALGRKVIESRLEVSK